MGVGGGGMGWGEGGGGGGGRVEWRGWNGREWDRKEWGHVCHTINSICQDHSPIFIMLSIGIILLVPPCFRYHHNQN